MFNFLIFLVWFKICTVLHSNLIKLILIEIRIDQHGVGHPRPVPNPNAGPVPQGLQLDLTANSGAVSSKWLD